MEQGASNATEVATAIKILLGLTLLSLGPAVLIVMTSFIGFIVYLPFVLIDIIVASILMSMGMLILHSGPKSHKKSELNGSTRISQEKICHKFNKLRIEDSY